MADSVIKLDATTLRGLAHPLRVRILGLLREHGPATATTLAERLGQSTGATSYHLRQLATYGFVVDDPDRNVGRERWWRAAHNRTTLGPFDDTDVDADVEAYLRAVAALYADRMDRFVGECTTLPADWNGTWTLSDSRLRLTPDQARSLRQEIFAAIARYDSDDESEPPAGTGKVVVQFQVMPFLDGGGER